MELFDDELFINNMKLTAADYINPLTWLETLLSGDEIEIAKLKKKTLAVKKYNEQIEKKFRAGSQEEKKEMIKNYKNPKVNDEFATLYEEKEVVNPVAE